MRCESGLQSLIVVICIASSLTSHEPSSTVAKEKVITVLSSYTDLNAAKDDLVTFNLPLSAQALSSSQLYDVGESLLMKNQPAEACPYLARATDLNPGDSFAHANFAIALHQVTKFFTTRD